MNYYKKIRWLKLLAILLVLMPFKSFSQLNINRVEYYLDNDPGVGYASTQGISFPAATDVTVSFNVNLSDAGPGLHVIGVRSRDGKGAWSMDEKWLVLKPFAVTQTVNLINAEYYIDYDKGYGNCQPINFNSGKDRNLSFVVGVDTFGPGLHVIGVRSQDANGSWSLDNQWLFVKSTPSIPKVNIVQAEYYVDKDSGYGKCLPINVSPGLDLDNLSFNYDATLLSEGLHVIGMRTKDAKGAWSVDNIWLFSKSTSPKITPQLRYVEYYVDGDPGYAKATPVAIDPVTNLVGYNIPVNITGLTTGSHGVYFRSSDANGAWNLEDSVKFNIGAVTATPYINVNSISKKTVCAGSTVDISFDAKGNFDSTNVFTVQLSNINGSFASPKNIGSVTGKKSSIVKCSIPSNTGLGFGYRVRVVSTSQAVTGATGLDTLTVVSPPDIPTITANGPTTFCQGGNVKLTSSVATSYLWTNGDTTRTTTINKSGNYRVTVTNASGCNAISLPITVTVNPLPVATVTANGNTTDVCPGQTVMLTASPGASYLWSTGAITQSITVNSAGNYFVTIINENGCSKTSDPTGVTYQGCNQPGNPAISNISATGARLSWSAVNCAVGYQYQWRIKGTSAWTSATTTVTNKPINNLTASTTYQWRVITGCQTTPDTISSGYISGPEFTTLAEATTYTTSEVLLPENEATAFGAVVIPNPVKANAVVELQGNFSEARITLSDLTGKVLWKSPLVKEKQIKLPLGNLASGIYMVNVYSGKETRIIKIVKD